ncbi:ankyrin repeat-containing domain protein [Triangularia verruculosa]|uniref:Ankyrin repeat-containing domain protein n=1 Tax=Triangularia verruculosa TaxID=2587418 RepID=A0AAN7AYV5_9PEZI|nr:ankyrin repeat-containing domain protein [Triangularia verruculosa]
MEAKEDALFFLTFTPSTLSTVFPNRRSYVYRPLAEGFIRLLRIHPHPNPGATIECSILEYPLLSSQRTGLYEALSYVWGPPPPEENPPLILVDGREFVVGENLYAALLSLRDPWLERIIWIDAICINQRDDDEKGHQVGSMAKIYSRAREVLVWLGPATASSGRALKVIQSFATLSEDEAGAELEDKLGIKELLERHWFKRIWVLQEVAAARHVVIKCGSDEVTGQAFCSGIEVLVRRWKAEQDGEMQFLDALFNSVTRLMRTADRRPRHEQDASPRFYLNISPVGDLIEMYGHREATDCRDKVYALLGMCSDDPGAAGLMPNYSISWESLIQQLMSFILKLSRPDVMNISANGDKIVIKSQGYVLGMVLEEARELGWIQRAQQTDLMWKDPVKGDTMCWSSTGDDRRTADAAIVKLLSRTSRSLDSDWPVCRSLLWLAALTEKKDLAQHILELGVVSGVQEMCWAIQEGHPAIAHFLFDTGRMAKDGEWWRPALDNDGKTALMLAIDRKLYNRKTIKCLFEAGLGQLDVKDCQGRTPLMLAAYWRHKEIVRLIIDTGHHHINARDDNGDTALVYAMTTPSGGLHSRAHRTAMYLINRLADQIDLDVRDRHGRTILMLAARQGWGQVFSHLIETGHADLNAVDHEGRTALMHSLRGFPGSRIEMTLRIAICTILVDDRVNVEITDVNGESALTWMQEMQRKQRERDGKDGKDAKDDEWARYRRAQLQYHVEKIQSSFWSGRWGDLEDNDPEMVRPEEGWRMFAYPDDEVAASGL